MDEPIPARMLNELVYCHRLFHLMHVQRVFVDSADTVEGRAQHARARPDSRAQDLASQLPWSGTSTREVTFTTRDGALTGKFDVVASDASGALVPVEAKHGAAPKDRAPFIVEGLEFPSDAWPNDRIQLGAQALLLRDAGERCEEGRIYYRGSRSTVVVAIDHVLVDAVHRVLERARALRAGAMPAPLMGARRCVGCSLHGVCLPDEVGFLQGRAAPPLRRLVPSRADGGCLYVVSQRGKIGKSGESLTISIDGEAQAEVPLKDVEHVSVFGNAQVTTQALQMLTRAGRSLFFHSLGGLLVAKVSPAGHPALGTRRVQFRAADDPARCLAVARALVVSKVQNQRTLVRRNLAGDSDDKTRLLLDLDAAIRGAERADDLDGLRGHEGAAARRYFDGFADCIGSDADGPLMTGRSRRPPLDPVNAALSFGYAILVSESAAALARTGLDPDLGFFHQAVPGRPALALDLVEPFRPLIVDSVVLRMFSTRQLARSDFAVVGGHWRLHDAARKAFLQAFERRMDDLVTHPLFEYRLSYRRLLELEARLLARHLEGELPVWTPMVSR